MTNELTLTASDYISIGGFVIFILGLAYALWNRVDKNKTRLDQHDKEIATIKKVHATDIKEINDTNKATEKKFDAKFDSIVRQNVQDHQALQQQLVDMNTAIGELPMKILELIK
jgi:hypothetical protein